MQLSLLRASHLNKLKRGKVLGLNIVLSSPSGAGKTTITKKLSQIRRFEIDMKMYGIFVQE